MSNMLYQCLRFVIADTERHQIADNHIRLDLVLVQANRRCDQFTDHVWVLEIQNKVLAEQLDVLVARVLVAAFLLDQEDVEVPARFFDDLRDWNVLFSVSPKTASTSCLST